MLLTALSLAGAFLLLWLPTVALSFGLCVVIEWLWGRVKR